MNPKTIMLVAGDPSGDAIAADLVRALVKRLGPCSFFGAGGPKMAEAGVALEYDLTANSVIGISDVIRILPLFFRRFKRLVQLALERKPELIILVDSGGLNSRLARAIRKDAGNWHPKIVQYVSPQVWASRPGRADKMAKDFDLLLCLFSFEKEWYAKRLPNFHVEFVGHPIFDRHPPQTQLPEPQTPTVLLLPGSRTAELRRHLPVMLSAAKQIAAKHDVQFKMVVPNESLANQARTFDLAKLEIQTGDLSNALSQATIAIAKTGTVTLECAFFRVPTVTLYKTTWLTYLIGRMIVQVKYLSMPNLLANEAVFPEFIQAQATAENISRAAGELLDNPAQRNKIKAKLADITADLGGPGAAERAATAILAEMDVH